MPYLTSYCAVIQIELQVNVEPVSQEKTRGVVVVDGELVLASKLNHFVDFLIVHGGFTGSCY
jgi:hypothetical protein